MLQITQKFGKYKTIRLWREFDWSDSEEKRPVIVILQEPLYLDTQIEDTLIHVYNYLSTKTTYNQVFFFNFAPMTRDKIQSVTKAYLSKVVNDNIKEMDNIIKQNTITEVITGIGTLPSFKTAELKVLKKKFMSSYQLFLKNNNVNILSFYHGEKPVYPIQTNGCITDIKKYSPFAT